MIVPTEVRELFKLLELPKLVVPTELLPLELLPTELLPIELLPIELVPTELLPIDPLLTVGLVVVVVRVAEPLGVLTVVVFNPELPGALTLVEPGTLVVVVVEVPAVVDGGSVLLLVVVVTPRSLLAVPVDAGVAKVAPPAPSRSVLGGTATAALVAPCAVASVLSMPLRSIFIRV